MKNSLLIRPLTFLQYLKYILFILKTFVDLMVLTTVFFVFFSLSSKDTHSNPHCMIASQRPHHNLLIIIIAFKV